MFSTRSKVPAGSRSLTRSTRPQQLISDKHLTAAAPHQCARRKILHRGATTVRWMTQASGAAAEAPIVHLSDGSEAPAVAFGTGTSWGFGRNSAEQALPAHLLAALKAGYTHIDTAEIYNTEHLIGQALQEFYTLGGKREDLYLSSKVWQTNHQKDRLIASCHASLAALGVDRLDLYLVHYPVAWMPDSKPPDSIELDPNIDLLSTWRSMEALVDQGLVKSIGVSNFSIDHLEEIVPHCRIAPVINQVEFHPCMHDKDLKEYCSNHDIKICGYAPTVPLTSNIGRVPDVAQRLASKYGKTAGQILLRWSHQHAGIVLTTTIQERRLEENLDWLDFELSEEEMEEIDLAGRESPFRKWGNDWRVLSGDLLFPPGPGLGFAPKL